VCSKFFAFFSSSEINHSRTTEFCYESGAVKVSHSFASVLLLLRGNIFLFKMQMNKTVCACPSLYNREKNVTDCSGSS